MSGPRDPGTRADDRDASSFDLVGALPAIVWEADGVNQQMLFVSPRARDIVGFEPEEWLAVPRFWETHVHPDDLAEASRAAEAAVASAVTTRIQYRFLTADGTYRWFQDSIQVIVGEDGGRRLIGVMVDVNDEHLQLEALEAARARAATGEGPDLILASPLHKAIVDNLSDGVYYVDPERRIDYWNHGAERLTGYAAGDVVGHYCYDNILCHVDAAGRSLCHTSCPLLATIRDGRERQSIVWLRHHDGHRVPVQVRTAPIRAGDSPRIAGGVEIFNDATGLVEARDAAEAARRDALTDPLTGLPNRRLLDAVLASRQDDLDRHQLPFGFLMVDIDLFKHFNDEHGHDVGDLALRVVASTLKGGVRSGDTVVRWGGEEFAIVAAQADAEQLQRLAERLLRLIRATEVPVGTRRVPVRVSIGGALAHPGEPLDLLFVRADRALLAAKAAGRDRFQASEAASVGT